MFPSTPVRRSAAAAAVAAPALLGHPILRSCSRMEIARLLNHTVRRTLEPGEPLFREGEESGSVFWIEAGELTLSCEGRKLAGKSAGWLGIDGIIGYERYTETAIAATQAVVSAMSRSYLDAIAKDNIEILHRFFFEYEHRHQAAGAAPARIGKTLPDAAKAKRALDASSTSSASNAATCGWLLMSVLPLMIYYFGQRAGGDPKLLYFSAIIVDAVVMWIFNLVPAFVPPLLSILLIILFDVAPPKVALSGFSSGTFFMCLSIFGISALMIKSGLAYRLSLNLLIVAPPRRSWYAFMLFFLGVALSPIVPSRNGRIAIVGPFLIELLGMIKARERDPRGTQFIVSALYGAAFMSPIFLTGSSLNLILYGMFDEQARYTYQWVYWLLAASLPGLLLGGGFALLSAWFFRSAAAVHIAADLIREQKRIIGPMSGMELGTLATVVALAVLIPTLKIHKVDIPWLMLSISIALLIFGMIGQREFRAEIDWPILLFIGAILAWTPVISLIGLDGMIGSALSGVAWYMKHAFYWFVAILGGAMMLARLFLPVEAAVIIFATVTLPIAAEAGISPWPVAFILLMMSEAGIFPYQNLLRLQLDGALAQHGMQEVADRAGMLRFDLLTIALRLGVIYASIPFWKYLNVL